jgi:hypothetical protein
MTRFCDLSIATDFRSPVPGSVFSWSSHEHLIRVGKYRAVGPHPGQEWLFQGDEIVQVEYTGKEREGR